MKFAEDKLELLDEYFTPKKESEKWMLILGLAGMIAYFAYAFLLPETESMYKKSETVKKSVEKTLKNNTTYLNSITVNGDREYYVRKYDNDIKQKNMEIVKISSKIRFINQSLDKLSGMLFNQRSWSKFLNTITDRAEAQNVEIEYITNKYVNNNGSFGYVMEIGVGCKGDYKSIVKFMNETEQNRLVTDIYATHLTLDKNSSDIMADINISVWGDQSLMKKIAISFIVFSLAASADLSVGEIEKMVEQIHKKREGIHLETLQETKEPFVRLEEDEATKLVIPEIIEAKLTLHAIVNGKAYISNAWVGVEENIMGYTLKYIGENGVVLRKGNSIKKLFLSKNRNGFIQVEERK